MHRLGDVLCLSHLRWGFVYQRPNHLMARWARRKRVFFVEEPLFDADSPRMELQAVGPRLHVAVPHLAPSTTPQEAEASQRELLDGLVREQQLVQPVLWLYTPLALPWAAHLRPSVTVYDCMDELSHFHGAPAGLKERERELFRMADLVFTGGHSLYESKRSEHPRVHAFPSSVDAEHFGKARSVGQHRDPQDQAEIPRPRVGFFGVIDERLDLELLRGIAALRSDLEFVLIGPVVKIDPNTLPRLPNIHWLGPKKYQELPEYIAGWDVAMMPFARNDATKFISPTKTLEYLAAGKPVVSTSIRDVVRPYGDDGLVRIADTPFAFARAIQAALDEPGDPGARDALLKRTSWDSTFEQMHALVEAVAEERSGESEKDEGETCSTT